MLLSSCAVALPSFAQGPDREPTATIEAGSVEVLIDREGKLDLTAVSQAGGDAGFVAAPGAFAEAPPGSSIWVRLRIADAERGPWLLVVGYVALDRVCVHWPVEDGFRSDCAGGAMPFAVRRVRHRGFVFPPPPGLLDWPVLIEAQSDFPLRVPLELTSPSALYEEVRSGMLVRGLYYGALLALVLYNLFLFAGVRERVYLFYGLHLAFLSAALFGFEGLGAEFLWPSIPWLRGAPMWFLGVTLVLGTAYVHDFLNVPLRARWGYRVLWLAAAVAVLGLLVNTWSFSWGFRVVGVACLLFAAGVVVASGESLRSGYRPSWYLVTAIGAFVVLVPVVVLASLQLLPWSPAQVALIRSAVLIGALSMSFGLADRYRRLMAERARLIPELEARNAEMERFTYTVSHDLKAPLITIKGFVGRLRRKAEAEQAGFGEDLDRIEAAAGQMGRLLDELLELSRLGQVPNSQQEVDLGEVARDVVEGLRPQLVERGVAVQVSEDLPRIVGDPPRIRELFQNLLENALKFMGEESAPEIEIGCRPEDGESVLFVRDNGIGIESRFHDKVFGLFERLDPAVEGTGIGLAIVSRIVELHGGRVWVESEGAGGGSTFCFTVPGLTS